MRCRVNLLQSISGRSGFNLRRYCVAITICALLYSQIVGCAAISLSPHTPPSMEAMSKSQRQEDLLIAIHPLTDDKQQIKYFGKNLTDQNIIPILVVASNNNTSKSFVIDENNITAGNPFEKIIYSRPAKTDAASISTGQGLVYFGAFLIPLTLLFGLILAFNGGKLLADATVVHNAITENALYIHTVSPQETISGFVFFKVPEGQKDIKNSTINVLALELESYKVHNFDFSF